MYTSWIQIIIFICNAAVFSILLYGLNFLLFTLKKGRYRSRHAYKVYEFGTTTIGFAQTLNNSHFFILSTLFIIFDVELLYLYIWIIGISPTNTFIYKITLLIFVNILLIGLFYELINGLLTWYKPKLK